MNVQGIKGKSKQAELKLFCEIQNPDILFGTESHLDENYLNNEVFPEDYSIIRRDRNKNGGGVFIAFKNDLLITEICEITNHSNEIILAKLQNKGSPPLYLGVFYRPPDSNENPLIELEKQINYITSKDNLPNFTIAGDFNLP